jgi:hypothetical protein
MELPDDVLTIVREYSRPVFKHYQVYNKAMDVLGVYGGWDALKEKLHTDADKVIPPLLAYQEAFLNRRGFEDELTDFLSRNEPMDPRDKLDEIDWKHELIRQAEKYESTRFQALRILVYPKDTHEN